MDRKQFGKTLGKLATNQKALFAIVFMLLLMLFFPTNFYTVYNLTDLVNSSAVLMILAFGASLTVISGGCDLSIGGVMVVSGIVAIKLMDHMNMWLAILCAILVGTVVGFINGFLVVQQKTEPFIITLGMGMTLTGIAQEVTDARPVTPSNLEFMKISNGMLFGVVTNLVVIMLVLFVLLHIVMRYTQFGRSLYAIGGDYEVARYSGIKVIPVKWGAFVISGTVAALAGVLLSSKLNSGSSIYGETTALIVNCGIVVGGISFAGGIGSIPKAALGLLAFGILSNSMNMLQIGSYYQTLLQGLVIVAILWLDSFTRKRKRERV